APRSAPGLQTAAHQALTRAGRHEEPGILLIVPAGRARAGGVRGLAVVLPRLGDAVALFGLELWFRRRAAALALGPEGQRKRGDHGGRDQQLRLVHLTSPFR